jgi:Bacterial extracellular solute-binding protein
MLAMAPLDAYGADLVVWWEKGFYPEEDEAVAEVIAAFEQETGKEIELVQPTQDDILDRAQVAIEAGQPPDFLFSTLSERYVPQWAYEDRLADGRGRVARPFGFALTDPGVRLSRTRLLPRVTRSGQHLLPKDG